MSDPVTNAEIEDVLSSIRRLVSTDDREQSDAPKAVSDEQDKLVLTPSQRVDEAPQEDEIPEAATSLAQYAIEAEAESDTSETGETTVEMAQGEDDTPVDDVVKDHAGMPEFKHQEIDENKAQEAGAEGGDDHEPESGMTDEIAESAQDEGDHTAEGKGKTPDLQARIASVEAALVGRDDEWEPDGEDDGAYAGGKVTPLEWEDHRQDEVPEAAQTRFEAAYDEGFEPETEAFADEFTPSATQQDDHLDEVSPEAPAEAEDEWQLQGDILDEEALRDMVSEIVRQELQGALGERITRNVRKLVRREIHRALASQDFE